MDPLIAENRALRARLAEAEETLDAIRNGKVDALVVAGVNGEQIFTLQGADYPYRVLIEGMGEGALILTAGGGVVFYANQRLAEMLKTPLEQLLGTTSSAGSPPPTTRRFRLYCGSIPRNHRPNDASRSPWWPAMARPSPAISPSACFRSMRGRAACAWWPRI